MNVAFTGDTEWGFAIFPSLDSAREHMEKIVPKEFRSTVEYGYKLNRWYWYYKPPSAKTLNLKGERNDN